MTQKKKLILIIGGCIFAAVLATIIALSCTIWNPNFNNTRTEITTPSKGDNPSEGDDPNEDVRQCKRGLTI